MEELRDSIIAEAGKIAGQVASQPEKAQAVKDLVEASCQLDMHIRQHQRDAQSEQFYFGLSERVEALEKKAKAKKK